MKDITKGVISPRLAALEIAEARGPFPNEKRLSSVK